MGNAILANFRWSYSETRAVALLLLISQSPPFGCLCRSWLGSGRSPWSCLSSGPRMDFLSQVRSSQLSLSESLFLIFSGEEMAHKIATGLKVPGLATVSSIIFQVCLLHSYWPWLLQPAGALLLVVGLVMLALSLIWGVWARSVSCWFFKWLKLCHWWSLTIFRLHPYHVVLIGCI